MNYIFCSNCGAENENDAKFCEKCGVELKKRAIQEEKSYVPTYSPEVKKPIMKESKPAKGEDLIFFSYTPKTCFYICCLCCVLAIPIIILFVIIDIYFYSIGIGSNYGTTMSFFLAMILPFLISFLIVKYMVERKSSF